MYQQNLKIKLKTFFTNESLRKSEIKKHPNSHNFVIKNCRKGFWFTLKI